MSNWPFRFIHGASFHLETPPSGVREVPDSLHETFLGAAYASVERLFDTAIHEEVDFVVLAGDLLQARYTGPRGPLFLVEQFQRLAEKNIRVYWAGGTVDPPDDWPSSIRLPENVHRFRPGEPQEVIHRRDDTPLARITGLAHSGDGQFVPSQFEPDAPGLFVVGLTNGSVELGPLQASRVDYWALGGTGRRQTLSKSMPVVHDPGSPQGRQPSHLGPHGCSLVQVDRERNAQISLLPCDVLRWQNERVEVPAEMEEDDLTLEFGERLENLASASPGVDLLVSLTVAGSGPLVANLRQSGHTDELLNQLHEEFGTRQPATWVVALEIETSKYPGEWYEQDSIRSDFLCEIDHYSKDAAARLGLEMLLDTSSVPSATVKMLLETDRAEVRAEMLRKAAALGVDLLGMTQEGGPEA